MRLRLSGRARHVAFIFAGAGALSLGMSSRVDGSGDRAIALVHALSQRGLEAAAQDVQWLDQPGRLLGGCVRAVVRAAPSATEASDLFLVDTTLSPQGVLFAVDDVYNVTETSGADESRPVIKGDRIAYVSMPALLEVAPTVHVLDLAGQPEPGREWTRLERVQNAITNAQQTGKLRGIGRRTFAIEVPAADEGAPKGEAAADPSAKAGASGEKPSS